MKMVKVKVATMRRPLRGLLHILYILVMVMLGLVTVSVPVHGLQTGDRISAMVQTLHAGWKTPLMDLSLNQMPRFRVTDSSVLRVTLPRMSDSSPEMKLNPTEDLKVSLTFENNRLVLPWVVLFDAANKRSLRKLIITFAHDEYEVLRYRHQLICKLE
jgi:hypothetical protein